MNYKALVVEIEYRSYEGNFIQKTAPRDLSPPYMLRSITARLYEKIELKVKKPITLATLLKIICNS